MFVDLWIYKGSCKGICKESVRGSGFRGFGEFGVGVWGLGSGSQGLCRVWG